MTDKHIFLGARKVGKLHGPDQGIRLLWAEGGESPEEVAKGMILAGFEPEAVNSLLAKTEALKKSRARRAGHEAVAALRDALGEAAFARVVKAMASPDEALFIGRGGINVIKLRHDRRQHPQTGRFTSMAEPRQTKIAGGLVMLHQDTREGLARQLLDARLLGKREPTDGGHPNTNTSASHDGHDEDPLGLRRRNAETFGNGE
jgi:hypothetical protein